MTYMEEGETHGASAVFLQHLLGASRIGVTSCPLMGGAALWDRADVACKTKSQGVCFFSAECLFRTGKVNRMILKVTSRMAVWKYHRHLVSIRQVVSSGPMIFHSLTAINIWARKAHSHP